MPSSHIVELETRHKWTQNWSHYPEAEVYNEFDFSDTCDGPVTVSFGENIAAGDYGRLDFEPSVRRAEAFAHAYHGTLAAFQEVQTPFRIVRREWFLADPGFATVHVCFLR